MYLLRCCIGTGIRMQSSLVFLERLKRLSPSSNKTRETFTCHNSTVYLKIVSAYIGCSAILMVRSCALLHNSCLTS